MEPIILPKYFYTAKSFQGEEKSGTLEVKNRHELARVLHQQGLVLISVQVEKAKKKRFEFSPSFFKGISLTEKMMFTRNLQVMISAGVSLPRCLNILSSQAKKESFKKAIIDISGQISEGKGFSESLAKYPKIFPELFTSMIKVGEESGTLEKVLKNLTYQMEREHDLRSKIFGAMIYPAVVISAMVGIGMLMLIMVVPQLDETFKELGVPLPATTQFIMGIGNFLAAFWFLIPVFVILLLFLSRIILKTKKGKKGFDAIILKTPVISEIVKKTNSAQTLRTLSSLITSGVPIVRALEIISGSLGNVYFKEAITQAVEKVRKGGKLSQCLEQYQNLYPVIVFQMVQVGEETGQTSDILAKLADFFEEEVTNATKNLSSLVEPVLMLLIGGAVGFFAISMIQPMYSMLGAIQ
ncbi:type II secretion system F family protein [Patescibacteria group bacterium]